jgi:hypothetical protein
MKEITARGYDQVRQLDGRFVGLVVRRAFRVMRQWGVRAWQVRAVKRV